MRTYVISIKPMSGFGTPIKGDTLFGHICWQAAYDSKLFGKSIDELLSGYATDPFVVISSAYPKIKDGEYALKRPDMPLDMLFDLSGMNKAEIIERRKELKGKRWMLVGFNNHLDSLKSPDIYIDDDELFEKLSDEKNIEFQRQMRKKGIKSFAMEFSQPHNTINRLTGTTGEGRFAPYSVDQVVYMPDAELVIFVGLREDISIEQVAEALKRIGDTGFGKDASTGRGRFTVEGFEEMDLMQLGAEDTNACYTLSPSVPAEDLISKAFFSPFTRFGRHGDILAKADNPFKNPVIMVDEGAVLIPKDKGIFNRPYIGRAVSALSKAEPRAVTQGFSLYIPLRVEMGNE